jgi:hypothetical protein
MQDPPRTSTVADLSEILIRAVEAVVTSQETLDAYSERRQQIFDATPEDELALPPLWYTIKQVAIELEMSASVMQRRVVTETGEQIETRLNVHTLNPTNVSLFGYQASAGLRVRVLIGQRGVVPLKPAE